MRDLVAAGWEVDPHTFTHPDLTTVSRARLRHEITESRGWTRAMFGVRANFFCYPFGRWSRLSSQRFAGRATAGRRRRATGSPGRGGVMLMNRIEVLASDGLAGFVRKLRDAR